MGSEGECISMPGPALPRLYSGYSVLMGKEGAISRGSLHGKSSVLKEEMFITLLEVSVF